MPEHNQADSRLPSSVEVWQRVRDYASQCKEDGTLVFTIDKHVPNTITGVDDNEIYRKSRDAKGSGPSSVSRQVVVKLWSDFTEGEWDPSRHRRFAQALVYKALPEFVDVKNGKLVLRSSVGVVRQKPAPCTATLRELSDDLRKQVEVGEAGEAIALSYEVERLRALGIKCPESLVEQVSKTNSSAGFDLKSDGDGGRCIEVKSSTSPHGRFYITANELKTLTELEDKAFLYFVHVQDVDNQQGGVIGEIRDPGKSVLDKDNLEAVAFRSTISLSDAATRQCDVTNEFHPRCAPVGRDSGLCCQTPSA